MAQDRYYFDTKPTGRFFGCSVGKSVVVESCGEYGGMIGFGFGFGSALRELPDVIEKKN